MKKILTVLLMCIATTSCNAEANSKTIYNIDCMYDGFTKHYKTYNYMWVGTSVKLIFTELDGTQYTILNTQCTISSK